MSKILITGGSGFLGSRLVHSLSKEHKVLAPSHQKMDILDKESLIKTFQEFHPEVVIHCAALSNTGYCEEHPEESFQTNFLATRNVAEAAKRVDAKFIFMSSDQVYNGTQQEGSLPEDAPLSPINHYGKHKLMAEQSVFEILPSAVGLRLTWMYDRSDSSFKLNSNILVNLTKAFQNGQKVKVAIHEHRGITNVWEVVNNIPLCFQLEGGIYNFGSENSANSFETFCRCSQFLGLPDGTVEADEERFKDQPRNLAMNTSRIQTADIQFNDTLTGFKKAIE